MADEARDDPGEDRDGQTGHSRPDGSGGEGIYSKHYDWGRVSWSDSPLAFTQVTVAVFPMAIGAALGDILPGT